MLPCGIIFGMYCAIILCFYMFLIGFLTDLLVVYFVGFVVDSLIEFMIGFFVDFFMGFSRAAWCISLSTTSLMLSFIVRWICFCFPHGVPYGLVG